MVGKGREEWRRHSCLNIQRRPLTFSRDCFSLVRVDNQRRGVCFTYASQTPIPPSSVDLSSRIRKLTAISPGPRCVFRRGEVAVEKGPRTFDKHNSNGAAPCHPSPTGRGKWWCRVHFKFPPRNFGCFPRDCPPTVLPSGLPTTSRSATSPHYPRNFLSRYLRREKNEPAD